MCRPQNVDPARIVRTRGTGGQGGPGSFPSAGSRLRRPAPCSLLVLCFLAFAPFSPAGAGAAPGEDSRTDAASGQTWTSLLNLEVPDQPFWDFIRPQRDYLRRTYGEEISTTYDLFLREKARLEAPAAGAEDPRVRERKTLARWPDPVVLQGRSLPAWEGRALDSLRVYACHLGRFVPVPYQFDEYTAEGSKVLPDGGPRANPGDGNGLLDARDELVLMAHDLGDRVLPGEWAQEMGRPPRDVLEIAVRDPMDGGTGWCYLLEFADPPPPRSPLNYATVNETYNQHFEFYVLGQGQFKVVKGPLYRQIFNCGWKIPDYAGGNFTDFVDRQKFRARVRLVFGSVKITVTEDDFSGSTLAVRDGPVRCTRRCWGQMHLPLGLKTPRIVADVIGYDTMFVCPVELSIPINPGLVLTDLTLYSGTDLNEAAAGGRWFNSNNLPGFRVDGIPSEDETGMDPALDEWRLVTGPWGAMMNRSIWDERFRDQAEITIRFTDDVRAPDPPEYHPGQIGMAYNYSTVRNLRAGDYTAELDWFFPVRLQAPEGGNGGAVPPEVKAYLDMYDHPLRISTGGAWFASQPRPKGARAAPPEPGPEGKP